MSWWKGARGEWYVAVQGGLFLLVGLGPRSWPGLPDWPAALEGFAALSGIVLIMAGGFLSLAGMVGLGRNLTPLPYPKDDGTFVENGPYRLVRHPIYGGLILAALGWAFWVRGWLTLVYALLLFLFLDIKSRREEAWLVERFPSYAAYQTRVRKLIPFLY